MARVHAHGRSTRRRPRRVYLHRLFQRRVLRRSAAALRRQSYPRESDERGHPLERRPNPDLLPGITINTSPTDYEPLKQMQLRRFDGKQWTSLAKLGEK